MKRNLFLFTVVLLLICAPLTACKKDFDEAVKCESITVIGEEIKTSKGSNAKYVLIEKNDDGEWVYQLKYTIFPDDATDKDVEFIYEENASLSVSKDGLVTYSGGGMPSTMIKIMAKDGSGASDIITLYFI